MRGEGQSMVFRAVGRFVLTVGPSGQFARMANIALYARINFKRIGKLERSQ